MIQVIYLSTSTLSNPCATKKYKFSKENMSCHVFSAETTIFNCRLSQLDSPLNCRIMGKYPVCMCALSIGLISCCHSEQA